MREVKLSRDKLGYCSRHNKYFGILGRCEFCMDELTSLTKGGN